MQADPKLVIREYENYRKEKSVWNIHYQVIAQYFLTRNADFTVNFTPGTFLNRDLFDSTGPKCANIAAGALLGFLWPEGAINFRLRRSKNLTDNKENKDYFDRISSDLHCYMNEPKAGLSLALSEYMREGVNFGTGGLGVFDPSDDADDDVHFLFQAWDVKRMVIEEGSNGFVTKCYYEREETIEQCAIEFGKENLSESSRRSFEAGNKDIKIRILHAIYPRRDRSMEKSGSRNMPIASVYIELGQDKLIKESGYAEMPVFVNRFYKNIRERYGRSMAMDALPDVLELNALREAEIVATEKLLDPPLGVIDDGRLGAGTIDTSAGAINVFNISGRIGNQPPVFPLATVGDLKSTKDRIEELKQSVSDHFYIDRLLDFDNETEMTLGEVQIREKLRAKLMAPIYARQVIEVFDPMIRRCFNMELQRGNMGTFNGSTKHFDQIINGEDAVIIPDEIAAAMMKGEDIFEIEYLTPAARLVQAEQADGIMNVWKFMNDVAQTQPEVYDNVDEDLSVQLLSGYFGAPREILRSADMVKQIRDVRSKEQQADKQFQQGIETAKAAGKLMQSPPAAGVQAKGLEQPLQV